MRASIQKTVAPKFGATDFVTMLPVADLVNHKVNLLPQISHHLAVIEPSDAFGDLIKQNDWLDWKIHFLKFVTANFGKGPAKLLATMLPFVKTPSDGGELMRLSLCVKR
jgi:hypothetical protein